MMHYSMLAVLLQVLLGTNCRVERPDYAHVDRFFTAVAKVPAFLVDGRCKDIAGPRIPIFAGPRASRKIAELRWGRLEEGTSNYCAPLVFNPPQSCPRGVLPVVEDSYEESVLIVVEQK